MFEFGGANYQPPPRRPKISVMTWIGVGMVILAILVLLDQLGPGTR